MTSTTNKKLLLKQTQELLDTLKIRFDKNSTRHIGIDWTKIESRLKINSQKLFSLYLMEETGGEPDVIDYDKKMDEYIFFDCSDETPKGRRSLCYDQKALESRKENKPKNNVLDMALDMGIEILTEDQYRYLQQFGAFDRKTSSWVYTPSNIRDLGGAIFGDHRFGKTFIYHSGAESYYAARGFRGSLRV